MREEAKRLLHLLATCVAVVLAVAVYFEIEKRTSRNGTTTKMQLSPAGLDTRFRLPLATGGALNSEDLKGRPYVLNFWASWCDACREERPELAKVAAFAGDRILGVGTLDAKDKLLAYDQSHPHGYRILLDEEGDVAARFQVTGLPHTFLIGPGGDVLGRVAGALKPSDVEELKRLFEASGP